MRVQTVYISATHQNKSYQKFQKVNQLEKPLAKPIRRETGPIKDTCHGHELNRYIGKDQQFQVLIDARIYAQVKRGHSENHDCRS